MKCAKPVVVSFSLLAFAGAHANEDRQAQRQDKQAQQPTQRQADMAPRGELRASRLQGMEVVNSNGEDIGDIDDIVIDLNSGKVHAAVLGFGGFLGVGEENYAFPIGELRPGKNPGQVVLNVDKQALENRDGFSKSQWPGMDDEYWGRVGGGEAAAGGGQAEKMNLVRASELIGKDVQDKSGQPVGELQDVVVGLNEGEVKSFVVGVRDGGRDVVPAKSLTMSGTENRLVLDTSAGQTK